MKTLYRCGAGHSFVSRHSSILLGIKDPFGVKHRLLALAGCAQFLQPTVFMHADTAMQWLLGLSFVGFDSGHAEFPSFLVFFVSRTFFVIYFVSFIALLVSWECTIFIVWVENAVIHKDENV